jgi:ribose transport system substrate-binding protein
VIAILVVGLCAGFVGYSYNLNRIQLRLAGSDDAIAVKPLKYHFMMIAQDFGDDFWQSVKAGAEEVAEQNGAAIEFLGSMIQDEDEILDCMDIAIASRVDGIIVYVTDEDRFTPLIDKAVDSGIPVITIESDAKGSKRSAFVGPDSHMAGYKEGELAIDSANGAEANVAIIIGGKYSGNADATESLLQGFSESIRNASNVKLATVKYANTGYFSAETIIRNILNDFPKVNTVVCTGLSDTMEVVQVLIDLNRESGITVIGYNTQQIREYIKNNNLFGSVYEFPRHTGRKSVEDLVNCLNRQSLQEFDDSGVYTVTRSNLVSFPSDS